MFTGGKRIGIGISRTRHNHPTSTSKNITGVGGVRGDLNSGCLSLEDCFFQFFKSLKNALFVVEKNIPEYFV